MSESESIASRFRGRLLLSAKDIQECFLMARGISISRTTLNEWEGAGLWVHRPRGRKWYRWDKTWEFYVNLNSKRKPKKGN